MFSLSVCNGCISSCSPSLQHHSTVPSSSINVFFFAQNEEIDLYNVQNMELEYEVYMGTAVIEHKRVTQCF